MERENSLLEKVNKLRKELAEAEKELKNDLERRRAELQEEFVAAGLEASSRLRKGAPSKGMRKCSVCGKTGHNARSCPQKTKPPRKRGQKKKTAA